MNNNLHKALVMSALATLQACAGPGAFTPVTGTSVAVESPTFSNTPGESTNPGKPTVGPVLLVAENFLQALAQIPELPAQHTTIAVRPEKSEFETAIVQGLQRRGYTIVNRERTRDEDSLTTTTDVSASNKTRVTFTLELKDVALKRSYIIDDIFVRPDSSLFVRGVPPDSIRVDDRLFVERFRR